MFLFFGYSFYYSQHLSTVYKLMCSFGMEKCENDTDEDEQEWESSFVDSDPVVLAVPLDAAAGSCSHGRAKKTKFIPSLSKQRDTVFA